MTPNQWKRLFFRLLIWAGLAVGSVLLLMLGFETWQIYVKERDARAAHMNEARALSELSDREAALTESLKRFDTPRGLEEEVRKRFPVARPGEEAILLVAPAEPDRAAEDTKGGFWERLFGWWPW